MRHGSLTSALARQHYDGAPRSVGWKPMSRTGITVKNGTIRDFDCGVGISTRVDSEHSRGTQA